MTQVPGEDGTVVPVTVIQAGPCTVLQVKTSEHDGYEAVQLGYEDQKPHRSTKPMIGHAAKARTGPKKLVREIRLTEPTDKSPGDVVTVAAFRDKSVSYVDVTGTTKGRGFTGVMKRHGFGGQPKSHGTERKHRSAGSIGGHAPGALGRGIKKGLRMSGQYGNERRTVRNQRLVGVDTDHHLLLIKGSIPGPNGGLVVVRAAKTRQ